MSLVFEFFIFLGLFKLIFLFWEDVKDRLIDERHSTFMLGVVVCLFGLSGRVIEMMVVLFVALFLLGKLKEQKWLTGLGDGDLSVLGWVVAGFWFFGWLYLVIFMIGYVGFLFMLSKYENKLSGLPVVFPIIVGFILVWIVKGLGLLI